MPRQARIVIPGELHHITQRGNYRQNVFLEDQDRIVYLKYLNEQAKKHHLDIFAYCLMDNHVHFIVRPHDSNALAKTFRVAHQKYSLYLNRRLGQHGHRWQARYYSCVVLGSHIPKAVRYVELNPVRARIVNKPWHYPWSSTKAHLGEKYQVIALADIREFLNVPCWKEYLLAEEDEHDLKELRESTRQGKVFGPVKMVETLQTRLKQKLSCQPRGRPRIH